MALDQSGGGCSQSPKDTGDDVQDDQDSDDASSAGDQPDGGISEADRKVLWKVLMAHPRLRNRSNNNSDLQVSREVTRANKEMWDRLGIMVHRLRDIMVMDFERNMQSTSVPLVVGLADHLFALDDRINKLEDGSETSRKKKKKAEQATNISTAENLHVKFYESSGHVDKNGKYQDIHDGADKGTYMCDEDPKHLIRALYTRVKDDAVSAHVESGSVEPRPDDVDLLSFGILSEPVAAFFEKLLDLQFENGSLVRFGKPFRPLIRHYHDLRQQLSKLEQRFGAVATERGRPQTAQDAQPLQLDVRVGQPASTSSPGPSHQDHGSDTTAAYDRDSAIPHFQELLRFVDKYLGKQIQLFDRIRKGDEDRVAFKDLWMVFDMKDIIYSPLRDNDQRVFRNQAEDNDHIQVKRHSSQAYQVVSTTGGMPWQKTVTATAAAIKKDTEALTSQEVVETVKDMSKADQTKTNTARSSYSELFVYCFYIDFNGVEYGIVRDVFMFKPYESVMDVRNLQAYPIRYRSDKTQDSLLERGRQFINVTKVSHMQYEGLTAGVREEVSSSDSNTHFC